MKIIIPLKKAYSVSHTYREWIKIIVTMIINEPTEVLGIKKLNTIKVERITIVYKPFKYVTYVSY